MILDAIFTTLFALVNLLVSVFPSFTGPDLSSLVNPAEPANCAIDAACRVGSAIGEGKAWVNVTLLSSLLGYMLPLLGIAIAVKTAIWVYDKLPAKAS